MPAIKLFGRKWLAATDDFVFPGLFEISFRFLWLVLVTLVFTKYYNSTWHCARGGDLVRIYLAGVLSILAAVILVLVILVNRSAQGTIMDVRARRCVPAILAIKIFLILPEIAWNVLGSMWVFGGNLIDCSTEKFTLIVIKTLVLFSWMILALTVFGLALVFDPLGSLKLDGEEAHHQRVTGLWMWRFRWACCWMRQDKLHKEAFREVAGLFSALFRNTNMAPSDFIAGFILLRVKQKKEVREYRRQQLLAENPSYTLDVREILAGSPSWMSLELASHYFNYAIGAYSWPFVLYRWPCSGFCRLTSHLVCCACIRSKPTVVQEDNCCLCNLAGLKYLSKIDPEDILYASFENSVFQAPFFVALDHKTKSVVITIRGSISLRDIFTDLTAGADKFEAEGLPPNSMAHRGMIIGAKHVRARLNEHKILESAFALYPDYKLVISGHSLGAGIGVLLALHLRPKYPSVKVYCISPPAAVLTREAARVTEEFTFSVGVGDDFVMRLSVDSTENIRTNILDVLRRCRLPKYRVMLNGFGYAIFGIPVRDLESTWTVEDQNCASTLGQAPLLDPSAVDPENSVLMQDWSVRRFSRARLYTPGRILYITRRKLNKTERQYGTQLPRYEVRWAIPEEFTELLVQPRMVLDHLPENVYKVIETVLDERELLSSTSQNAQTSYDYY